MDINIGITAEDLFSRYEARMNLLKKSKETANSQALIALINSCSDNTTRMMHKFQEFSEHLKKSANQSEPLTEEWRLSIEAYKEAVENRNIPLEFSTQISSSIKTVIETEKEAVLLKNTMINIMASIFTLTLADILQPDNSIINKENSLKVLNTVSNIFFPKEAIQELIELIFELTEATEEKTETADNVLLTYENYIAISKKWINAVDKYIANF